MSTIPDLVSRPANTLSKAKGKYIPGHARQSGPRPLVPAISEFLTSLCSILLSNQLCIPYTALCCTYLTAALDGRKTDMTEPPKLKRKVIFFPVVISVTLTVR